MEKVKGTGRINACIECVFGYKARVNRMFLNISRWLEITTRERSELLLFMKNSPGHRLRNVNLEKGRFNDGVPAASPMIESAMGRKKKKVEIVGIAYLSLWGILPIYRARFPNLRFYFRNKICFSLLRIILLRDKICFSLSRIILLRDKICFSLSRIIL